MATFLQTLRRRLRRYLEQRRAKTDTETLVDGTRFCSKCRQISAELEELMDRGFDNRIEGHKWYLVTGNAGLDHIGVEHSRRKECGLCNFLTYMLGGRPTGGFYRYLFVSSAKDQYGIFTDFSHISDSFSVGIRASKVRTRWLPLLPYDENGRNTVQALEVSNDPGKISGRLVGPYADFELIKSWFDDCTVHHGTTTCHTDASILSENPGLRVIDCSSRRLISWSQLPTNQDRNYVALSYVWGTKPDGGNEGDMNISDRTVDWPLPSKLPPLIEDSITAVTKLGFRYLWIDRYCVPQGDQEAKHTQIQNMDSIYGSASLTIIAAASNDPSQGLPGDIPRKLRESKWNTRAWTMQEAFLSCRCLIFFDDGAYFQCSSPRSHRFEAIHEPSALLQLRHKVLSTKEQNSNQLPGDSLIVTKIGKVGYLKRGWFLRLVEDYFCRNLTFENDTLNALSGVLKYMQSFKPSIHNLWGVLMLPEVMSMPSGRRTKYNLVRGLAWCCLRSWNMKDEKLWKLERRAISPRKEMFPSWTWADWKPRVELHGGGGDDDKLTIYCHLELRPEDESFTSLVDLSVELDDGRIVSWARGHLYDSDVSWLATLPKPPRILHIQGYTANPQLRYMTEEDWAEFNERTILPIKGAHPPSENDGYPGEHWYGCDTKAHRWIWIDADGQHLQPLLELTSCEQPRCWKRVQSLIKCRSAHPYDLSADACQIQSQRGNQTDTMKPYTECTFDFRAILLGYDKFDVFYMMLIKTQGPDSQNETFERVNVLKHSMAGGGTVEKGEILAKLTGKHAESYPGTPWVKMNTRIA
ncbi:heterokaryon incompatibility protein-domain-containing protein [Neurospora crassa]|nr:heterokaryon incompatibility protein-domain-containing protein [Neurospora crassa]